MSVDSKAPVGWQTSAAAQRMRDAVSAIVSAELDDQRPLPLTARVTAINATSAVVQGITDDTTIVAYFTTNLFPTQVGQLVRVLKIRGQYWITDVLSGNEGIGNPTLINPTISASFQQTELRLGLQLNLPTATFTTHGGRYVTADAGGVVGHVRMIVYQTLNSALVGVYEFPIQPNGTLGLWKQVQASQEPGTYLTNSMGVEVMIDTTGFEFRIRNLVQGSPTPGGYFVDFQLGGAGWFQFSAPAGVEASSTQPLNPGWGYDTGWAAMTGYTANSQPLSAANYQTFRYRIRNNEVHLNGAAQTTVARTGIWAICAASGMPAGTWPKYNTQLQINTNSVFSGNGITNGLFTGTIVLVGADGSLTFNPSTTTVLASNGYVFFNTKYPLD